MMTKEDYQKEYGTHQKMRDHVRQDQYRLQYHLMPPAGYLNDPNGLCQKDGIYHIYFQYTPFDCGWGTKLWGHYTTKDMIHFQEEEPFLYPDTKMDKDGVYSGSAFVKDNLIHYFYTGNVKLYDRNDYDYINEGREQNTIHMTSQDGYHISQKELILTNDDYPQDMSKHVRDPKIFEKDGYYYMAIGGRTRDNQGCVLLYKSDDLQHFKYYNRLILPNFGYMWECPDLFELDGQLFLMTCPQGLVQQGYNYANVYQMGYFKVNYDFQQNTYTLSEFHELDRGFDIYAPQSFLDEKGRRIQYAWMGIPDADYDNQPTIDYDWQHALTMPKVLTYHDGQIYQQPMEEMKALREKTIVSHCHQIKQEDTICFEMNIELEENKDFHLKIRDDAHLTYQNHILTLSLGQSGHGRATRSIEINEVYQMTIFSDTSSLEIFINDGQTVFTTRVYSESLHQTVEFLTSIKGKVTYYPLKPYVITK
ncbi:glycoside hydrolase family 32 protein [Candidatus Stoquefichus massiliensis]|uniref:glycoside hydrolase family 32 protein n=1 Tax=Candidatus Stoquefichus massiliensis TaxID=1470350 RepID=UPI0004B3DC6A|nr:glycoside hydrolase family 32 protein [Candidatus Stoquefichus massiliensis]